MALAGDVLAQARSLLNDDSATVWSDASLLPKLQLAHLELQSKLWIAGSPVVREESDLITVTAGSTDLGNNQPEDLLTPTKLFEYDPDGSNPVEMTEVFYIPKVPLEAHLRYWCWRKEKIFFLGATQNRKVRIQYRRKIEVPSAVEDPIGVESAELYLAPRVAALAAGSVGNADVLKLATEMAAANFADVLVANRGRQRSTIGP